MIHLIPHLNSTVLHLNILVANAMGRVRSQQSSPLNCGFYAGIFQYIQQENLTLHEHIAKQWVEALKSGEYKQTTGALKDSEGFCCLGVLVDLYRKSKANTKKLDWTINNGYSYEFDTNTGILPREVQSWAGMYDDVGATIKNITKASLSRLNDDFKYSFDQIAEVISEHWKDL